MPNHDVFHIYVDPGWAIGRVNLANPYQHEGFLRPAMTVYNILFDTGWLSFDGNLETTPLANRMLKKVLGAVGN